MLLEALSQEHECLYKTLAQPVARYCRGVLPAGTHKSSWQELAVEDLQRLQRAEAVEVLEWLIEKLDSLTTKLTSDPSEAEEVGLGCGTEDGPVCVREVLRWLG